jgi:hypothetical protein
MHMDNQDHLNNIFHNHLRFNVTNIIHLRFVNLMSTYILIRP